MQQTGFWCASPQTIRCQIVIPILVIPVYMMLHVGVHDTGVLLDFFAPGFRAVSCVHVNLRYAQCCRMFIAASQGIA